MTASHGNFNSLMDRLFAPMATSFVVTPRTTYEGSSFLSLILGTSPLCGGGSLPFISIIDLVTRAFPAPVRIGDIDLETFLGWKRF